MSQRTIFSFLVTLLLVAGIAAWSAEQRDECSAWLAGDTLAPHEMVVKTGDHQMVVPCEQWFPRQPPWVQVGCLAVAAGCVVVAVSAWADMRRRAGRLG